MQLFEKLRKEIPEIALRSTFISGFPTETEEEHKALMKFLQEAKLTNAGFFAYSREPDTPAYKLKGQIPASVKKRRVRELYAAQENVAAAYALGCVGKRVKVLCDGIDYEKSCFVGRSYFQAPEIDGRVYFTSERATEGCWYTVHIDRADTYDLFGHTEEDKK